MAVVGFAVERPGSPEASFECGKHTITRKFRVLCDSVLDGPITVANAIGIPPLFSIYTFGAEIHPYCRCRSIEPERMAPASLDWEVTCVYETPEIKDGATADGGHDSNANDGGGTGIENDQQFENPLAAMPEIETHWETKQVPMYVTNGLGFYVAMSQGSGLIETAQTAFFTVGAPVMVYSASGKVLLSSVSSISQMQSIQLANNWTGSSGPAIIVNISTPQPLKNSAGEIFVPPPMMDDSSLILQITRNENINSPILQTSALYMNTVNSDTFFGYNPGMVKCQFISCQRQNKQLPDASVLPYLRVTYNFHVKQSWDMQLLDKGTYYWYRTSQSAPWNDNKFITADGQPRDGLLDGTGQKLATGASPVYLTVRPYNWQAFASLNLPQSFAQVQ